MNNTALIADDEENLREYLKVVLTEVWPELEVVAEASNGLDALDLLQSMRPDVAFLDIKMPGMSGIAVAQQAEVDSQVVFITAYDHFAVKAFELEAIDYLLKPLEKPRLSKAVKRLKLKLQTPEPTQRDWQRIADMINTNLVQGKSYIRWIKALEMGKVYIIPTEDVRYIKSGDKYTTVVTPEKSWIIRKSIKELEDELDPEIFWRIHRGVIVNASYILEASRTLDGRYELHLLDCAETISCSRAYAFRFKHM